MKITLYTAADKRPDFIEPQYRSIKKYLTDDHEIVVLNNAFGSKNRRKEISDICMRLGIRCIEVKKDPRFTTIGKQKVFTWLGSYRNANVGTAYPIKWAWETMIEENKDGMFAIIDSDMFLARKISLIDETGENDAAFIIQYRGLELKEGRRKEKFSYIWNAFCIFRPSRISALKEMNWDCGVVKEAFIEGLSVDVGGYIHYWLKKHSIRFKHISELALHHFDEKGDSQFYLEATLNGNYHFSFDYDRNDGTTSNYRSHESGWKKGSLVLPHLPEKYEEILVKKIVSYFETYIFGKQSYPSPTFLGFIEFEDGVVKNRPFIVHSKAGSGYMRFGEEYGRLKLLFIEKILDL